MYYIIYLYTYTHTHTYKRIYTATKCNYTLTQFRIAKCKYVYNLRYTSYDYYIHIH